MLFSVLDKMDVPGAVFDDKELPFLVPYYERLPANSPLRNGMPSFRLFDRLTRMLIEKDDKNWQAAMASVFALDVFEKDEKLFKSVFLPGMAAAGEEPQVLGFLLTRALQKKDMRRIRFVVNEMKKYTDESGVDAARAELLAQDSLLLRIAASCGDYEIFRYMMGICAPAQRSTTKSEQREWLMSGARGSRLMLEIAAGGDIRAFRMMVNRIHYAGVQKEVMSLFTEGCLMYAAKREERHEIFYNFANEISKSVGPQEVGDAFSRNNSALLWALMQQSENVTDRILFALKTYGDEDSVRRMLASTWQIKDGTSCYDLQALIGAARDVGGEDFLRTTLSQKSYFAMHGAAMNEDSECLTLLLAQTGNDFQKEMFEAQDNVGLTFLERAVDYATPVNLVLLAQRALAVSGPEPVQKMLRSTANNYFSSRTDYMDVLDVIMKEIGPLVPDSVAAIRKDDLDAFVAHKNKEMPPHIFWQKMGGARRWPAIMRRKAPDGMSELCSPWQFKPDLYREILPYMKKVMKLERSVLKPEEAAYRLSVLFANRQEVERYLDNIVKRARPDDKIAPVTGACDFRIPARGLWTPSHWRGLTMKYGQSVARFIVDAPHIEEYCQKNGKPLPKTPTEIRDVARFVYYTDAAKNPELASLCVEYGIPQVLFNEGVKLMAQARYAQDNIPLLFIDGVDIGKDNYYLQKLLKSDPRGLLLGHITNSCQSLDSNGAYAARHGTVNPDGGFYAWFQKTRGKITPEDRIVAESWVWLDKERKTLVFDSFERLSGVYNHLALPFMEQAAHELTRHHGITEVRLGAGGNTPEGLSLTQAFNKVSPAKTGQIHPDSELQYVVTARDHRVVQAAGPAAQMPA